MLLLQHFTKICIKCQTLKRFDQFHIHKQCKFGLSSQCAKCKNEYSKNDYANSTEKYAEKSKIYRLNNKELCSNRNNNYRLNNLDKSAEASKKYRLNHAEKVKEYYKNYYKTDNGKAVIKNKNHKRRTKLKQGDVTSQQILELQQNAKVCYWCNEPLKGKVVHIDHYVPIKLEGEHTLSNLVVSCNTCNNKKHAKDPIEFANSIGKLL